MKQRKKIIIFFFFLILLGLTGGLSAEAAETSLKVPTDAGALVNVGSVSYQYVTKSWSQWKSYFANMGYYYSHCYYEVEVWGADRQSKVHDICWCAFKKGDKIYWSAMMESGNGYYTVALNHWNYIGASTDSANPGGNYTGSGAHWYYTNGEGLIYENTWICVPISDSNVNRLGYFYVNTSGHMLTGWNQDTAGNWYYFKIDHVSNEDGASVKTGVSSDRNCSTVCWTEVKSDAGNGSYGLYRYNGIDVRTNFYLMDTDGNYPVSYNHSVTNHLTPSQVPPLNAGNSVSYDRAALESYYGAPGFYLDTSRGNCTQNQQVYLTNQDWQSVSIAAFQCYIARRQYTQTISYRKKQQGMWQMVAGDTRYLQKCYESVVSLANWNKNYAGYKLNRILRNGAVFSANEYMVSGNNEIYFDYVPIQYTVSYQGNGANQGSMPDNVYTYDSSALLAANQYRRTNYRFAGWALSPGGKAVYQDQAVVSNWTTTDGGRINLYAVWEQIMTPVTVQIYRMNVTGTDYVLESEENATIGLGNQIVLSDFSGKYAVEGFQYAYGSVDGKFLSQFTVSQEKGYVISLYFDRNQYAVTVNGQTGLNQIQGSGIYYYGARVCVSAELAEGYSFLGWKGTGVKDSNDLCFDFIMPASAVKISGATRAHTYCIVFEGNGATDGDMSGIRIDAVYGEEYSLPVNEYKRVTEQGDSKFCGWSRESGIGYAQCEYTDGQSVKNLTAEDGTTVTLYAIWDDMPGIVAEDLYYTLAEAQNGAITYEALMAQASAYDREQISQENPSGEMIRGKDENAGTDFGILDYAKEDFLSFSHGGSVTVTYQVVDSGGNRTRKQIRIYLADTTARQVEIQEPTLRFISSKYLDTLAEDSKWRSDSRCSALLTRALDGTESFCNYEFSVGAED